MHVHHREAVRVLHAGDEALELRGRLRRLPVQAGLEVGVEEPGVHPRERVGIAEPGPLDLPEEAFEEVDRVPHIAEGREAPRLPVDGVHPCGRGLASHGLLGPPVPLEDPFRLAAPLEQQPPSLLGPGFDPPEAAPPGLPRDLPERRLGLTVASLGQRDVGLPEPELKPRPLVPPPQGPGGAA